MDNHYQTFLTKGDNAKSKNCRRHSCTRHCSTLLVNIIKIFQRVFDLQSRHKINGLSLSNIRKEDNAKSKRGRVVILACNTLSGPVLHFCQVP